MIIIILLAIVGVILIGVEVLLPGGILGIMGAAAIIGACYQAYELLGLSGAIWTAIISTIAAAIVVCLAFKLLPRTAYGKQIFLNSKIEGSGNTEVGDDSLIGKKAVAVTRLLPTGTIEIDNKQYEASSQDGHVNKGDSLLVVGRDAFKIIVKKNP